MAYLTPSFLRESRHAKVTKKGRYLRDGGYKKRKTRSPKVKVFKKGRFIPKEYSF
tara:strand:- start:14665 stop:14829 length:165 start_codon:yes stop_codon:yes gene_type:complete